MTGKSDIYTFLDCPDRIENIRDIQDQNDINGCRYFMNVYIPNCDKICNHQNCPRGYAR